MERGTLLCYSVLKDTRGNLSGVPGRGWPKGTLSKVSGVKMAQSSLSAGGLDGDEWPWRAFLGCRGWDTLLGAKNNR